MPAIGQDTGRTYLEKEVLIPEIYEAMCDEPLFRVGDEDVQVKPVRNEKTPNFRMVRDAALKVAVQPRERDPTHNNCVAALVKALRAGQLKVWSPTFTNGKRDPYGDALFSQGTASYSWWQDEGACRMGVGERRYIQPDICGRAIERFYPSARQQNVIIEVINTHPPELETFYALLHYSCFNHIVLFYFVAEGSNGSQYSGVKQGAGEAKIWVSHYLLDGRAFKNGKEIERSAGESDQHWYDYLMSSYFGTPLKEKTNKSTSL